MPITEYIKYYRKHYSKYYNHEAIKRHMIEKKIYSPSDFRYYYYQLLQEFDKLGVHNVNDNINKTDKMLINFEKKYIEDSIDFLFEKKKNKDLSSILSNVASDYGYMSFVLGNNKKIKKNQTEEEHDNATDTIKKLLNLLSDQQLRELDKIIS